MNRSQYSGKVGTGTSTGQNVPGTVRKWKRTFCPARKRAGLALWWGLHASQYSAWADLALLVPPCRYLVAPTWVLVAGICCGNNSKKIASSLRISKIQWEKCDAFIIKNIFLFSDVCDKLNCFSTQCRRFFTSGFFAVWQKIKKYFKWPWLICLL